MKRPLFALALLFAVSSASAQLYPQRGMFNMLCAKESSEMFDALEKRVGERIAYHLVLTSTKSVNFSMWITENKANKTITVLVTRTTAAGSETCMVWGGSEIIPLDNPPIGTPKNQTDV